MPEGDSYARAAARLQAALSDSPLVTVDGNPEVRTRAADLRGQVVSSVRSHGKHLFIDTGGGLSIHVWMGMPGRWRFFDNHGRGPDRRDAGAMRLLLATERHTAVCYSAPTVEVERREVVDRVLRRLGPDLLAPVFDTEEYRRRAELLPPHTSVADLLLDQRVLAGIGNEFKCEVLFLEGLHPCRQVGSLDPHRLEDLAERARRIMLPNARRRGARITTGDRRIGAETWVYGREGRPCRRCATPIAMDHLGERHPRVTFWCPCCQPEEEG